MKYVSYDIESTDGRFNEGNLCEFGYCIADENLNICEQNNILIKPIIKVKFINNRIKLAYTLAEYNNAPEFCKVYNKLKKIFEGDNIIVLGHAIHNDVECLNAACATHALNPFNYKFIDTQTIYCIFKGLDKATSLDKIGEDLSLDFVPHKADEDAKMALLTLKHVSESLSLSVKEIIELYKVDLGVTEAGVVTNFFTPLFQTSAPSLSSKNSKRRLINAFLLTVKSNPDVSYDKFNKLYKKRIAIDDEIEMFDATITRRIIQRIYDIGGKYVRNNNACDIFVSNKTTSLENKQIMTEKELLSHLKKLPELEFDDKAIIKAYLADKRNEKSSIYTKK